MLMVKLFYSRVQFLPDLTMVIAREKVRKVNNLHCKVPTHDFYGNTKFFPGSVTTLWRVPARRFNSEYIHIVDLPTKHNAYDTPFWLDNFCRVNRGTSSGKNYWTTMADEEFVVSLYGGGPWGFRLQGGKDFGRALTIQSVIWLLISV